jgi:hypothetical protein
MENNGPAEPDDPNSSGLNPNKIKMGRGEPPKYLDYPFRL